LLNYKILDIPKEHIHILVGYQQKKVLNPNFKTLMAENQEAANFYPYPDLRIAPKYTSSIRPNLLKQHFEQFPHLEDCVFFYHDSDVLFSRIPQIEDLDKNGFCYVSDTRNYLDLNYIRRTASEELLEEMAAVVGLSKESLVAQDANTGGAQYILKGLNATFWEKVEKDSEALYVLMQAYNTKLWEKEYPKKRELRSRKRGIQAWCADMWAVLWNLWYFEKKVLIHSEMKFSWPYSPIEDWDRLAILHYSGNIKETTLFFRKVEYLNYLPWYDDQLDQIPDPNCSHEIVKLIRQKRQELDHKRSAFKNSCITIAATTSSPRVLETFELIRRYISKTLDIEIVLCSTKNELESFLTKTEHRKILSIPIQQLIDVKQITRLLSMESPASAQVQKIELDHLYKIDRLFFETFSKVLDEQLFYQNLGKFNSKELTSEQSILLINRLPLHSVEAKDSVSGREEKKQNKLAGFDLL
jgi:hypothetical protein